MNPYQAPRLMKEQIIALRKWHIAFVTMFVIVGIVVIVGSSIYAIFTLLNFEQNLRHSLLDNNIKESYIGNIMISYGLIDLLLVILMTNFLKFCDRLF